MKVEDVYKREIKVTQVAYNGKRYHREVTITYDNDNDNESLKRTIIWYYGNQDDDNIIHYSIDSKWYESIDKEIEEPELEKVYESMRY